METSDQLEPRKYYGYTFPVWVTYAAIPFTIAVSMVPVLFQNRDPIYSYLFMLPIYIYIDWKRRKYPILTVEKKGIIWNFNGRNPTLAGERYIEFTEFKKIWIGFQKIRMRRMVGLSDVESIFIERHDGKSGPIIMLKQFKSTDLDDIKQLVARIQEIIEISASE